MSSDDINKLLDISIFQNNEKTPQELNKLTNSRFNISNFDINTLSDYTNALSNYYVFPIFDKDSSTHYAAMCVNKVFANSLLTDNKKQNSN